MAHLLGMMVGRGVGAFGILVLPKVIDSGLRLAKTARLKNRYLRYLRKGDDSIVELEAEIVGLWREAGLADVVVPLPESGGYGQIGLLSQNVGLRRAEIVRNVLFQFLRASGIYRSQLLAALDPTRWLRTLDILPDTVLVRLGVRPGSAAARAINLVFLLAAVWTLFDGRTLALFARLFGIEAAS